MGATSRFIMVQYLSVLFFLGLIGTIGGIFSGIMLQYALPFLFSGLLPDSLKPAISWVAVAQGFALGLVIVALFAFLPVYRLKDIKPAAILRKETIRFKKSIITYSVVFVIMLFFGVVILEKMGDAKTGGYFILGIAGLVGFTALVTVPILWMVKKARIRHLMMRQALKGLFRPGNATRAVIITMTASLAFIFSIYLVEKNLNHAFVASYPPEAPNLFFLDIQPDQKERFARALGADADYYPIIRAKLLSINDRPVNRKKERKRRGDNLGRTFNLTYRHHLLDDEVFIAGKRLYPEGYEGIPVSILDTVAEIPEPKMALGDRIAFRIQGVPLTATVTSIRSRVRESLSPFFYFVFPDAFLKDAPHTIFAGIRMDKDKIARVQNRVVAEFPNITVIDVTESVATISNILKRLSMIVRFFTLFSIIAGILLIVSSVFATRFARVQEAVYYKILGAKGGFVMGVFIMENLFLGLISGGLALGLSQAGSWIVCSNLLHISYKPFAGASLILVVSAVILAVTAGLIPSISIIRQKPMGFLKTQSDE